MPDTKPSIHANGSGDSNSTQITHLDEDPLSQKLIDKLEEETDLDLTEGTPLQDCIDLESLDNLYPNRVSDEVESPVVKLWYRQYEITIHARDEIEISK